MNKEELLDRVKKIIRQVEPEADIILYGSRARGDARHDSDWDFLILLDGEVDSDRTLKVRYQLYELEWECGEVLCSIVRSRQDWETPLYQGMGFYKAVRREGILL